MSNHAPFCSTRGPAQPILVVESCLALRHALCRWLRMELPHHHIEGTNTAEEALMIARTHPQGIIVMDIRLDGIDGIDATRDFKRLHPACHVVLFTHYDAEIYRERARDAGATALVLKRRAEHDLLPQLQLLIDPSHHA